MSLKLGTFGAWFNPMYEDSARVRFVAEAEAVGYTTAWLGMGRRAVADLSVIEQALDATTSIVVATAIINMWTNDASLIARSYHRITDKHPDRFLLGIGIGHPESIETYRNPLDTIADYLDRLDANGVPQDHRVLAALGPRALRLAAERTAGTHPYLVVPGFTRDARRVLGPEPLLAPEHKAVLSTHPDEARAIGRAFVEKPYLGLSNYVNNLRRHGFTTEGVRDGGSDRLIDALVLHGAAEDVKIGLTAHIEAGANHVSVQVLVAPGRGPHLGVPFAGSRPFLVGGIGPPGVAGLRSRGTTIRSHCVFAGAVPTARDKQCVRSVGQHPCQPGPALLRVCARPQLRLGARSAWQGQAMPIQAEKRQPGDGVVATPVEQRLGGAVYQAVWILHASDARRCGVAFIRQAKVYGRDLLGFSR